MESDECQKCGLFRHVTNHKVPSSAVLAWNLYNDLCHPVVRRFRLTEYVLNCYELSITTDEFFGLLEQMASIDDGIEEWHRDNPPKGR